LAAPSANRRPSAPRSAPRRTARRHPSPVPTPPTPSPARPSPALAGSAPEARGDPRRSSPMPAAVTALEHALDYGRGGNLPYRSGRLRLTERNARTRLDADDVEGQGQGRPPRAERANRPAGRRRGQADGSPRR